MSECAARLRGMLGNDPFAQLIGAEFVDGEDGHAVVAMTVGDTHLNFLGGGHGGAVFTLADIAFGLASNSHDKICIGIDAHIAFVRGVVSGDQLLAEAREVSRSRKTAVYRVDVTRHNTIIAAFTGTVHISGRDHGT